jgi:hypothetical protein
MFVLICCGGGTCLIRILCSQMYKKNLKKLLDYCFLFLQYAIMGLLLLAGCSGATYALEIQMMTDRNQSILNTFFS